MAAISVNADKDTKINLYKSGNWYRSTRAVTDTSTSVTDTTVDKKSIYNTFEN